MKSLKQCPAEALRAVEAVFFDIDDTFSTHGQITAQAYEALWKLRQWGIPAIPVTGRPAGWCDFFARMWPVTAVVGENGAFYMTMTTATAARAPAPRARLVRHDLESKPVRLKNKKKLLNLRQALLRDFKGLSFASDQNYREFDLAIDYCEDVRPWSSRRVNDLMAYCAQRGAQVKLSSIHVNTWFGRYDKWSCVVRFLEKELGLNAPRDLHRIAYLGDSPNDEPFFQRLPLTVGVANVRPFLSKMTYHPQYVASREGGGGFAEFVDLLGRAQGLMRRSK